MSGDPRVKNDLGGPERAQRSADQRAATEGDGALRLDDDVRVEMFRNTLFRTSLPNLPPIPGYHVCWLTTTNPRDNLPQRRQIGYEPITPEDVPGFEHLRGKDGEMAGYVSINEMVAFKIRDELYQKYMMISHHEAPLEEEEKLENALASLQQQARGIKGKIVAEEGSMAIRQLVGRRPSFTP